MSKSSLEDFFAVLDAAMPLEKSRSKGSSPETMAAFASLVGNPEKSLRIVHVTGSKGKGSVSSMLARILSESGFRVGLFTSPHILSFFERMTDGFGHFFAEDIYKKSAADFLAAGRDAVLRLSWFEATTAFAMLCFKNAGCDFAVLECGMGGRMDATNYVESEFSLITSIELEHCQYLGDTIEKIATEKGGIIKPRQNVFCGVLKDEAKTALKKIADERGATIYFANEFVKNAKNSVLGDFFCTHFDLAGLDCLRDAHFDLKLRLLGEKQAQNAALSCFAALKSFPTLQKEQVCAALQNLQIPCRYETCQIESKKTDGKTLRVIFDGAHTAESMADFAKTLSEREKQGFVVIFSCAADKDPNALGRALFDKNAVKAVFLTKPGKFKKCKFDNLCAAFETICAETSTPLSASEDITLTLDGAIKSALQHDAPIVVTGSFYLIAEIKMRLTE